MVQNHLLQVLSLAAMEPPVAFDPEAVRDEKLKVLKALRTLSPTEIDTDVVRGQYAAGSIGGEKSAGTEKSRRSAPPRRRRRSSPAPAHRFWRWAGVPFYLRSGKRLPKRVTEIAIEFKEATHLLFGRRGEGIRPNVLAIRIQPDEGISLNFGSKVPAGHGGGAHEHGVPLRVVVWRGAAGSLRAMLLDCLLGDNTLFTRADEVEASWNWVSRVHRRWAEQDTAALTPLPTYPAGTGGPEAADALLAVDGRTWRRP